uniref:Uncharacterized protein n=2 Tax=Homalodisca liturata TaxID=320908 RepID=A0A1B6IAB6_9HEMI
MDHSDHSQFEIINELKAILSNCDELTSILPNLIECFVNEENAEVLTEVISLLLGPAVQALPLPDVDRTIFQPFLPLIKDYLSKTLSSIHELLKSQVSINHLVPEITRLLEVCVHILTDIESLLVYLVSLEQVSVADTFNVPKNIVEIVYHVFIHCQKSQEDYKEAFTAVRSELMSLFHKCHNVQLNLFILLNEKLKFKCTLEDEVQLLLDVLDILSSMGEVMADLDAKSLVEHWKGYVQLTLNYAVYLRSRLCVDRPINYLAININQQLSNIIFTSSDKKVALRSLKITTLELKVLIKLCENYKGYLVNCHRELLNCLVSLAMHASQEVAPGVAAQVLAGAAPLLTTLIPDPLFLKIYFEYADKLHLCSLDTQVGYCKLNNILLKKLIHLYSKDEEVKELWFKPSVPVVENVFKILHQCSRNGSLFEVQEDDIYQALLVHIAAFLVASCTEEMFPQLERLLVRQLLQPSLWPAMFSSDLLCLIARFGCSELCLQLASLLCALLSEWQAWDWQRPEWVYVSWSLSRLLRLLSPHHLQAFPSCLPSLPSLVTDITTFLTASVSVNTVVMFQSLMERFMVVKDIADLLPNSDSTLTEAVCEVWRHVSMPPDVESTESSHWFLGLYSALVTITCGLADSLSNCHISYILDVLIQATSVNSSILQCGSCLFLRSLATKNLVNDSSQTQVCRKMSSLFVHLMQKTDPLTKQIAMDTFSFLAYVTKYEQIVADTVANDCQLQVEITNYLEGVPTTASEKSLSEHLKCLQQEFVHKCKRRNRVDELQFEETVENRPSKKLKSSFDVDSVSIALQRMEKDLDLIEECRSSITMTPSQVSSLINIYMRLGKIVK